MALQAATWRAAMRGAAAREQRASAAAAPAAAAAGCRRRRAAGPARCVAAAADGGAPSPLLTSGTAQRQKVSMMSLGCPKNVVDGAHAAHAALSRRMAPHVRATAGAHHGRLRCVRGRAHVRNAHPGIARRSRCQLPACAS
jgi:hypothetical protein